MTNVPPIPPDDRDYVTALARGLELLQVCGGNGQTLAQIAERCGLARATARRFLLTLHALGYVEFDGKLYRLTPRVLVLSNAYLGSMSLPRVARPFLERICRELKESCSIAVLDGSEIVYVAREQTSRIMSVDLGVGSRLPAVMTSLGRVLLAALPVEERAGHIPETIPSLTANTITDRDALLRLLGDVGAQGWCMVDQELEPGLRSIAVPLRDAAGNTVAALNVGTQAARVSAEMMTRDMLPVLQAAAAEMRPLLIG